VWKRAGALEAARARRPAPRRRYDFSAFDDRELEALAALAERAEAADGAPNWTEAELATLARLEAKLAATGATL
jgi:hypothetical protein